MSHLKKTRISKKFTLGWHTDAALYRSDNFDHRTEGQLIDTIVIHAISLPPDSFGGNFIEDFFCNKLETNVHPYFKTLNNIRVSAHFLIKRCGKLLQFVSTYDRAWHAGASVYEERESVNDFSIGIELEGCDTTAFENEQYITLAKLSLDLQHQHPLITNQRIVGHSDIAPERKTDPGPCFNWSKYKNLIKLIGK